MGWWPPSPKTGGSLGSPVAPSPQLIERRWPVRAPTSARWRQPHPRQRIPRLLPEPGGSVHCARRAVSRCWDVECGPDRAAARRQHHRGAPGGEARCRTRWTPGRRRPRPRVRCPSFHSISSIPFHSIPFHSPPFHSLHHLCRRCHDDRIRRHTPRRRRMGPICRFQHSTHALRRADFRHVIMPTGRWIVDDVEYADEQRFATLSGMRRRLHRPADPATKLTIIPETGSERQPADESSPLAGQGGLFHRRHHRCHATPERQLPACYQS